jgi:hypothetical protein
MILSALDPRRFAAEEMGDFFPVTLFIVPFSNFFAAANIISIGSFGKKWERNSKASLRMILVTGASENHNKSLRQFIASFLKHAAERHRLIVWDLGLTEHDLILHPAVSYKVFEYTKYPDWFDITKDAGQYAWKPALLKETSQEYVGQILVWMDAGNLIVDPLRNLERFLRSNALYSSYSEGTIRDWTHPQTLRVLGEEHTRKLNRNGACIGFNLANERGSLCLIEWAAACMRKDVVAPEGSSRANHRQDQSVFSVLYYKNIGTDAISNAFLGYTIHNDIG